ncbi:AI-2E family transporter [Streptomyces sp. Z26]|uniref:AI-2E family transporter n=1 Tax=Streptomyces TaxID=1883 RepID=UPI000EF13463|nr:AI-2E family transporter [Streptomyces sp. Z26]RLL68709.1 AI-2E family transporter [Streptomyces sp. Z26]
MTRRVDRFLSGVQDVAGRLAERRARATAPDGGSGAVRHGSRQDGGEREAVPEPAHPAYAYTAPTRPEPAAVVPWGVRVAAEAGWRLLVLAGVIWVLMKVVSSIGLLIMAFAAGLLVTALLQPTVARLRRIGLGQGLATAVTFIAGLAVMGLMGWFVVWQVMDNLETLTDRVQEGIEDLRTWAIDGPFHVSEEQINGIAENLSESVGNNSEEITTAGIEGVTVIFEFLTGALLAVFVTLFLLYDGKRIWEWTLNFVPGPARKAVAGAGPRAWATLTGYVQGTVIVALIDAVFIGIGIYFLDVPMAVPLAVFIFLFAFIPIVGAVMSGALAVLIALVTNGVFTSAMVLLVVLVVQQIESHILQPFILGRLVRVHPLAVVLGVTGGSLIAGIPGAVVAVPLVAVTNSVVGYLRAYSDDQTPPQPHGPHAHGATAVSALPGTAGVGEIPVTESGAQPGGGATATATRPEAGGAATPDLPGGPEGSGGGSDGGAGLPGGGAA